MSATTTPGAGQTATPGSGQKARVLTRVIELASNSKITSRTDIHQATEKFRILQKRLKYLISLLQKEHSLMAQLNIARLEVAQQVAAIASSSPLDVLCAGDGSKGQGENQTKDDELAGISKQTAFGTISVDPKKMSPVLAIPHPYLEVHQTSNVRGTIYTQRFKEHVLKYAADWEASIAIRVNAGLKELDKQRLDLEHYTRKFEALRLSANKLMSNGKTVPTTTADKLKRNEMKLLHAKHNYEVYSSSFALLISEVTERCWKDLHPLLVKLIQFDSALAADENKNLSQLNEAASELKRIGVDNSLDPKGRLQAIQSLRPEELFTGDKSNPFGGRPMIEGGQILPIPSLTTSSGSFASTGSSGGPFTNALDNEWHSNNLKNAAATPAPASNGSGAFYNPFETTGSLNVPTTQPNNPFAAYGNTNVPTNLNTFTAARKPNVLSQVDMLDLAASSAPPPTLSDINEATDTLAVSSNQPTNQWSARGNEWPIQQAQFASGGFPASEGGSSWRSESVAATSFGGYHTQSLAPTPMATPPMPPPPPPAFSMYGNSNGTNFGGSTFGRDMFSAPAPSPAVSNLMGGSIGNPLPPERRPSSNPFDN